jgi:dethiobiotin synthetase
MTPQSLFVTGTDTNVGKTICTALLALHFMQQGADVGIMKPVASGCEIQNGELTNDDARWLKEITGVRDEMKLINPMRYVEPLAPLMAARRNHESTTDVLQKCHEAYAELARRHEVVIVEGVGGWMVPLAHLESTFSDCSDLVKTLQLPIVTVSRRILGTINHSLLTWRAINPQQMLGWMFCDATPVDSDDIAAQTSPELIAEISELPIIAQVPFINNLSRNVLIEDAQKYFCV